MNMKVLFLVGLAAVVAAEKVPTSYSAPQPIRYDSSEELVPSNYGYDWTVQDGESGNAFDHKEAREEYNIQGSYTVQLPDGRLQRVTYYVDGDSGFVAEVTYEGEARYPESREYQPPQTQYSSP
ncbi:cuticle protein 7-like [Panulirus ornatus]|uniref:cuticle protein 7-like n=1 Tax=Panulirus ornatus TaxID=150431 RepID=UPI003A86D438